MRLTNQGRVRLRLRVRVRTWLGWVRATVRVRV